MLGDYARTTQYSFHFIRVIPLFVFVDIKAHKHPDSVSLDKQALYTYTHCAQCDSNLCISKINKGNERTRHIDSAFNVDYVITINICNIHAG